MIFLVHINFDNAFIISIIQIVFAVAAPVTSIIDNLIEFRSRIYSDDKIAFEDPMIRSYYLC